jgi:signal transduction histidine kinase
VRNGWNPSRLACPSATSVWTWLIAFAPSMTTAVLHDRNLFGGSVVAWLAAAVSGALAAGAVLALAHLLLRAKLSWVAVLATFLIAGCARGLAVGWTALQLGLVEDPQFAVRAASGAVLAVFWLSIATLIVDGYRTHREARLDLQAREEAARHALHVSTDELAGRRAQAPVDVTAQLKAITTRLRQVPAGDADAYPLLRQIATDLHDLSSEIVRPLSHTVVAEATSPAEPPPSTSRSRTRALRTVISDAITIDPFRPGWLIALLFPSILMTAVRAYGVEWGGLGAFWIAAMAAMVLVIARRAVTPHLRRFPALARGIAVLVIWLLAGVASALPVAWSAGWGLGPERAWAVFGVPLMAYVPITCLGIAVITAIGQAWALDADAREARIAALDWQARQQVQTVWAERRQWGRYLHGSVQSLLTSTALTIETALRKQVPAPDIADTALTRLTVLTSDERLVQDRPPHGSDIEEVLVRIAGIWSRVATTTLQVDERVRSALAGDPAAAEAVIEIVREALANAVRHGHARRIDIAVTCLGATRLLVEVHDDGSPNGASQPGLGSSILDELCLEWNREGTHATGTTLSCHVPIAAGAVVSV